MAEPVPAPPAVAAASDRPAALVAAAETASRIDPARLESLRHRARWTLFAISALGSTGYIAAVTVGTLVAADIGRGAALGGLPTAAGVLGTAAAATLISGLMLRVGRRRGVLTGLAAGMSGALLALVAVIIGSIPLLLVGSAVTGFANGVGQLGRYVAADLVAPERRASAIGMVVWGSAIGAVVGPNMIASSGLVSTAVGLPALAGAYGVTVLFIALALVLAAVLLRPEPYALAHPAALAMRPAGTDAPAARALLGAWPVPTALVALVAGQVVMVLIMTMTPLHLAAHGHGLATVGFVLSAHTFGMFALSPISGRLTDRFGSRAVIATGLATMGGAALLSAAAPPEGGVVLTLALFLLGYGWNLGFVAGSALLTRGLALGERTRVQGVADGMIWSSAALASLSSGIIVAGASYAALGAVGLGLLLAPALMLWRRGAPLPTGGKPA